MSHDNSCPGSCGAAIRRHSVVHCWSNTSGGADVESRWWVAAIGKYCADRSVLAVGISKCRMGEFRLERIRRRCNISEFVGDITSGGDSAVVAHTESKSAPLVVGDTRVCTSIVVSRRAVVVGTVWAAPEVGETIAGHAQTVSVCSSTAGFVTESELAEVASVIGA